MSRLPLELYDFILPSLREDLNALKALSLSWRCFTPVSQRHLFSHVIIRAPWQCADEYHDLCGSASAFRHLLDRSPHIGEYVTSMEVNDRSQYNILQDCKKHPFRRGSYAWLHNDEDLPSCLLRLTKLQAFVIHSAHPENFSRALLDSVYQVVQLPTLIHLQLAIDRFPSVVQHSGKNLKHLFLDFTGGNAPLDHRGGVSGDPVLLCSLFCNNSIVPKALLDPGSKVRLDTLKRLAVTMGEFREDFEDIAQLFQVCRTSLEELTLSWDHIHIDIDSSIYLHRFPSLKRFHAFLTSSTDPYAEGLHDELPWFINFLKQSVTEAHPLEELSIELFFFCDEDEVEGQISELANSWKDATDILLNTRHFPRFQALKLRIHSDLEGLAACAVKCLEHCDFFKDLKSRLLSSVVLATEARHPIKAEFVVNPTWLSIEDRYRWKLSQLPPT